MSLLQLDELRVVVTGGGSGIGLATATAFAKEGAWVAALDLDPPDDSERIIGVQCDVRDATSVAAAVEFARHEMQGIDVLINNAGIGATGTVADNDIAEWQAVFDVNVFGTVRVTQACLPALRESSNAAIVNLASIVSWTGLPNRAVYGATKGAIYSLTLAMAADHAAEGIRVNCVCPGTVDTPWVGRLLDATPDPVAARANLVARQPIGRLGTADEIAAAICYLASPAAGYTTGTALQIDGGTHSFLVPK